MLLSYILKDFILEEILNNLVLVKNELDKTGASDNEILLEAYDKEWSLRDKWLRDGIKQGIEQKK